MKKHLFTCFFLLSISPALRSQAFDELRPATLSNESYATQVGNHLSCYTFARQMYMNLTVPAFTVGFYLSQDTVITTSDILVGTVAVPCMDIFTPSCSAVSTGPEIRRACSLKNIDLGTKSVPNGTYHVGTYVDISNTVTEDDETNNNWTFKKNDGTNIQVIFPGVDVSIRESSASMGVLVPNASGGLSVKSNSGGELLVSVFSIAGRLVFKQSGTEIALPQLNSELYILELRCEKDVSRRKIVL